MSFDPEKITFFAKTDARGGQVPFGIKAKDRQRHMYVIGKTGMGKSTLLENMAAQDIQNGEGMAFIDPHGSTAEALLDYVPEHRVDDVVYFAPFDLDNPISFNVMEDVGPDKRHLVVSGLMSTFKKIWVDQWSARMEYILTNALLALIEYPDTTLLSVNRLLSDKAYRDKVIDYCQDPAVKSFWLDEFNKYTERFAAEALPAIQNKVGQFTGNPLIRNIIGQPHSSFDIRKIMDEKKILIMNLSKGLVGETNANLLGSMLTTRIYLAAMSRADLPLDQMKTMPNFYFYVDEFQSFANATFANILSEARKYHLNLIIAHQYIAQMEEEVRDAVFGNVGTTVAFRVGPFDAEVLETVFSPRFLAPDLVNLGFAQIYLTLMIDGIGSQPFSAQTLPPVQRPHVSCKDMVLAASRQNFTKPRVVVEKVVSDLHSPAQSETPPKKTTDNKGAKSPNTSTFSQSNNSSQPKKNYSNNSARPAFNQSVTKVGAAVVPKIAETPRLESSLTVSTLPPENVPNSASPVAPEVVGREERVVAVESTTPNQQPLRATVQPQPTSSLTELRAVLSKISSQEKAVDAPVGNKVGKDKARFSESKNKERDRSATRGERKPDRRTPAPPETGQETSLAEMLKKLAPQATAETAPVSSTRIEEVTSKSTSQTESVISRVVEAPAKTTDDAKAKAELARLNEQAEAAFSALTDQVGAKTVDDPLATKKIERLIKQPTGGRTPFSA